MIMKNLIIFSAFFFVFTNCKSQSIEIFDISNKKELNYIVANIDISNIKKKSLYDGAFFITIFQMYDLKINYDTETDEVFRSLLISISPDGDYYTNSKLLKIENLIKPNIIDINQKEYPNIVLNIEYGNFKDRRIKNLAINLLE